MNKLIIGENDLATLYPELVNEWHPTKNGDITPSMVSVKSEKRVWWLLPFDDPTTGKHFDFEWIAKVRDRTAGHGCPYLTGKGVWEGFNDLATTDPDLAKEWHPTKNGDITPKMVSRGSQKKYWWLLPYDDPKTGKHYEFEWEANIGSRSRGNGCPFISGKAVYSGFNDLATFFPDLAKEWNYQKNGDLTPNMVTVNSAKKVWWKGKCGHEWETTILHRTRGHGCIYCAKSNAKLLKGFNDLQTLFPHIAEEWHPEKNGNLTASDIQAGSPKKIWWKGKCGHEWISSVHNRTGINGRGCPICAKEYKSSFPEQAIYFYIKLAFNDAINGDLNILDGKELDIYIPSVKTAIEYDGYSWHENFYKRDAEKAALCKANGIRLIRIREDGLKPIDGCENILVKNLDTAIIECLNLLDKSVNVDTDRDKADIVKQFTEMRTRHQWWEQRPDLLKDWDYKKNDSLTPNITMLQDKVWWKCHTCGYEWKVDISHRFKSNTGCPMCGFVKTATAKWKKIRNIDTGEVFASMKDACDKYGIRPGNLSKCCKGQRPKAGGYHWEYVTELPYQAE